MYIVIPQANIVNDPKGVQLQGGAVVHYCRIQYMGGEIRVQNPSKIPNGIVKDAKIELTLRASARAYAAKETRAAGALVTHEAQFGNLVSVAK